jgi:diguanylate cyclase (GGDEF)-like protein
LSAWPQAAAGAGGARVGELPLRIVLVDADGRARLSSDGRGVVLPEDGTPARFRLEFELPRRTEPGPFWVLRFNRVPLKELAVRAPGWEPAPRDFFHPGAWDGFMPTSFWQMLPRDWSGPTRVEVTAATDLMRTLRPQLVQVQVAVDRDSRELAIVAALYASLGVLGLVALALLLGSRERVFLSFLCVIVSAFLLVLVANGHAFALPGLRRLAALGGQSVNLSMFLLCASGIAVVRDYVGPHRAFASFRRLSLAGIVVMLALAAACLLGLAPNVVLMQRLVTLCWVSTVSLATLYFVGATVRRAWLAWPLLVALLPLGLFGTLFEISVRGRAAAFWGSYGYLIGLVLAVLLLMVALIGRIADFRIRHERERLARQATELKLMRQSALAELAQDLHQQLADVPLAELEPAAMRIALQRLLAPLRLRSASVVLYRPGQPDVRVIEPPAQAARIGARIDAGAAALRALARREAPVPSLDLAAPRRIAERFDSVWAGVPLDTGNFGSGAALIERGGRDPFSDDELALAVSFAETAMQQVAEARANQLLRRTAELDALTGVLNRSAIDTLLAQSFEESFHRQQSLAVLFVDLDHFKAINDTYGHACGDHCLRQVAEILRGTLRAGDHVGRYGGEEFLVLLPGCNNERAMSLGERLRRAVEQHPVNWQGQEIRVTISVGVSSRWAYEDKPDAVERADRALYVAKREGRNRVAQAA